MSGNPVPYDIQNGDLHQEYIALVHIKHPEYINWAVRHQQSHQANHPRLGWPNPEKPGVPQRGKADLSFPH